MTQWSLWSLVLQNRLKLLKTTMDCFTSSCRLPPPSHIPVIDTYHLCIASSIRRTPNLTVKMTFHLVQNSVDELGRSFWTNVWFSLDSPTVPDTRVAHKLTRWVSKTGRRASVSLWVANHPLAPSKGSLRVPITESPDHKCSFIHVC